MIYVWDIFIRIFHFFLIYAMIGAYISFEKGHIEHHALWGITILSLLVFRILWGVLGSYPARFKNFIFSIPEIFSYLKDFFKSSSQKYYGHNPIGGLSVMAMILCIFLQSLSGLAMTDDIFFEAPFYAVFPENILSIIDIIHRQNFNIILFLIGVHIFAVFFYLLFKQENLIMPMVTGYKKTQSIEHQKDAHFKIMPAIISFIATAFFWSYLYLIIKI